MLASRDIGDEIEKILDDFRIEYIMGYLPGAAGEADRPRSRTWQVSLR
jgi:hypothetical protein